MVEYFVGTIRTKKNITLKDLAQLSGVAESHIVKIEAGETNPSVEVMCKLAKGLQVPVNELFRCDQDRK